MQKIILFFILLFGVLGIACKQMPNRNNALNEANSDFSEYFIITQKARRALYDNDYSGALKHFLIAEKSVKVVFHNIARNDYFEIAKCYYKLNDSLTACKYLLRAAETGYKYERLKEKIGSELCSLIKPDYEKRYSQWASKLNQKLIAEHKKILEKDQYYRGMISLKTLNKKFSDSIYQTTGYTNDPVPNPANKKQLDSLWVLQQKLDAENFAYLSKVLKSNKYPNYDAVSSGDLEMLFFHVDDKWVEEHLTEIKAVIKKGYMHPNVLAHGYDYALAGRGEKQKYGFEVDVDYPEIGKNTFHTPIEDEANVNQRRKEIYLYSLEDHLLNLSKNMFWSTVW